jgi:hypothetical protein
MRGDTEKSLCFVCQLVPERRSIYSQLSNGFRFETQNLPELHLLHACAGLSSSLAGTLPGLVVEAADLGDCDLFTGRAAAGYFFRRSGTDDGGI